MLRRFASTSSSAKLSPAAARLLREQPHLAPLVRATGPKGHVLKSDVLHAAQQPRTVPQPTAVAPLGSPRRASTRAPGEAATFVSVAHSGARRVIAARLSASKFALPHAYVSRECTLDRVLAWRRLLKDRSTANAANATAAIVPSVSDFITRAAAVALRRVPAVNVVRRGDGSVAVSPTVDVSFAVSVDGAAGQPFSGSLLTPIVARADRLNVREIALRSKELIDKARAGKLKPTEYQGGSFCISNLGMFGITEFTAIINAPQSAILAVGAPIERLRADRTVATTVTVTLSIDNSAIEHDEAARWLDEFALHLEEPALL